MVTDTFDFLERHGGAASAALTAEATARALEERRQVRQNLLAVVAASALTATEVAARLEVSLAVVNQLAYEARLYAFKQSRSATLLFPCWQFVDSGLLPGLDRVLASLPDEWEPLDVDEWMTSPCDELDGKSPLEWLAAGRGPNSVVNSLDEELRR